MLSQVSVQPMLPVRNLDESTMFYEKTLGLKPVEVDVGTAVTYRSGDSTLTVYQSDFGGTNKGTAALWEVVLRRFIGTELIGQRTACLSQVYSAAAGCLQRVLH